MQRRSLARLAAAAALALAGWPAAAAPPFPQPNRPVRLVVPYNAGGPADAMARVVARELGEMLGATVIVDNKGGAAGTIGAHEVARAPADGHTLLYALDGLVTQTPHVMRSYPFDPVAALVPVARVAQGSFVAVAPPPAPGAAPRSLADLIAQARRQPGRLTYGSYGIGSTAHIFGEVLAREAGIEMVHVPYKGNGPAQQDVMAGRIDLLFDSPSSASQYARQGRMTALGVAAAARDPLLPEVPTLAEQGVAGLEQGSWLGVFAPAGLEAPVLQRLNDALGRLPQRPAWAQLLQAMAFQPVPPESAADFAAAVRRDHRRWAAFLRDSGIRID